MLLFTHLVHLPKAYASKPYQYYELFTFHVGLRIKHTFVCDHLKYYALRLAFKTVRRAFKNSSLEHLGLFEEHLKILFEDRMSDSSCCRQIRRRIGCRYGVQIYLSENRYILADKDRRSISITHTPKQYTP